MGKIKKIFLDLIFLAGVLSVFVILAGIIFLFCLLFYTLLTWKDA